MDTTTVILNLAMLVPAATICWYLVLRLKCDPLFLILILLPLFPVVSVSLGANLGAAVALVFGEQLPLASSAWMQLAPFYWVERPLYALQVVGICGLVGAFFSYGTESLLSNVLKSFHQRRTVIMPTQELL